MVLAVVAAVDSTAAVRCVRRVRYADACCVGHAYVRECAWWGGVGGRVCAIDIARMRRTNASRYIELKFFGLCVLGAWSCNSVLVHTKRERERKKREREEGH